MTANPIDTIYVDASPVAKSDVRGFSIQRIRMRVANADEIRNTDFSGQVGGLYVGSTQIPYDLDPSDTTTADDGTDSSSCIIDAAGNRFKNSQVGLLADLATILSNSTAALAVTAITIATETSMPNSRKIAVTAPLSMADGGAGGLLTLSLGSVLAVANGGTGMTTFSVPSNKRNPFSASHTIADADKNSCVVFTNPGGGYTCTFLNPSNYDTDFSCIVTNESQSRAVTLVLTNWGDGTTFTTRLYPLQSYFVYSSNGFWFLLGGLRRWNQSSAPVFYVDPSGSDSNDGLASGTSNAMKTVLACWKRIGLETETLQATIQLTPGATYNDVGELDGDWSGTFGRLITITGDPTNANPAIINGTTGTGVILRDGAWSTFSGIEFTASAGHAVNLQQKSLADFENCTWGTVSGGGSHIAADDGSDVNITGNQKIGGPAAAHWNIQNGSKIIIGTVTIDCQSQSFNFGSAFLIASQFARVNSQNPTYANSGSINSGKPCFINQRHSIFDSGGGSSPPGTSGSNDSTSNAY